MSIDYYDANFLEFFNNTVNVDMSDIYQRFLPHVVAGGKILDAGCGSGRDAKVFKDLGYKVTAFDASLEMAKIASKHIGQKVANASFFTFSSVEKYDGIWACASLLHVSRAELQASMRRLSKMLADDGVWYASFKYGSEERSVNGRYFSDLNEEMISSLVDQIDHIFLRDVWVTTDNRPGRQEKWLNVILTRHDPNG